MDDQTSNGTAEAQAAETAPDAELRAKAEAQAKRIEELSRAYADVLNERDAFRKRLERERDRQVESAKSEVAQSLLDAIDELRRALSSEGQSAAGVIDGVRMIAENLQRRVASMGLVPVETVGQSFDPNQHEAMDVVPVLDRDQDGMVIDELRGGWRAGDRVVRPARVRVARFVEPSGNQPQ